MAKDEQKTDKQGLSGANFLDLNGSGNAVQESQQIPGNRLPKRSSRIKDYATKAVLFGGAASILFFSIHKPEFLKTEKEKVLDEWETVSTWEDGVPMQVMVDAAGQAHNKSQDPRMRSVYARENPDLSLMEKYFCRGYKTSFFCSKRPLHPFIETAKRHGVQIKEQKRSESSRIVAHTFQKK